jgi:hypothetical protein
MFIWENSIQNITVMQRTWLSLITRPTQKRFPISGSFIRPVLPSVASQYPQDCTVRSSHDLLITQALPLAGLMTRIWHRKREWRALKAKINYVHVHVYIQPINKNETIFLPIWAACKHLNLRRSWKLKESSHIYNVIFLILKATEIPDRNQVNTLDIGNYMYHTIRKSMGLYDRPMDLSGHPPSPYARWGLKDLVTSKINLSACGLYSRLKWLCRLFH